MKDAHDNKSHNTTCELLLESGNGHLNCTCECHDKFEVVGKCDCGSPILRWMITYSRIMCAECITMWRNEARFMHQ